MIAKKTCYKQKVNLGAQPWLTARPTRDVIKALTANGAEVRFVGGCVRDWLGDKKRVEKSAHGIELWVDEADAAGPAAVLALVAALRSGDCS